MAKIIQTLFIYISTREKEVEIMVIIKRNGKESLFEKSKIRNAIRKANAEAEAENQLSEGQIYLIADEIEEIAEKRSRALNVEEIQDLVEDKIMNCGKYEVARKYIKYRYNRELNRRSNTTDEKILSLIECENEEAKQENANKNPTIASVQRDYMAGEVSKDLTKRILLPQEIVDAHEKGIIHFHDADYYSQHIHNCDLINLEDMLQNGTVISGTLIEKPHSFSTACNIATQIIAQVASSQYGGQSITLSHLAPFVDVSRQKIMQKTKKAFDEAEMTYTEDQLKAVVENKVKEEIEKGVQIIQYQVVTLMTTNGQAPFITVFMYLNEVKDEQTKHDLAMIIEEVLKQRIQGVKNEKGVWITPAFPKLIYALEEDNIKEGSKYWYLTELAAKCTAKRMVPDYISEKKMLELKGDAYPCMGCVDGKETVKVKGVFSENPNEETLEIKLPIEKLWKEMSKKYQVKLQPNGKDYFIETPDLLIYDQKKGFVKNYGIIKNHNSDWLIITFSNGAKIKCTEDHPFETEDGRIIKAKDLTDADVIAHETDKLCYPKNIERIPAGVSDGFSYDVTTESEHFTVSGIYSHNCRSFLTPDRFTDNGAGNIANAKNYKPNEHKYYGRFNQGVVTINLPDAALSAKGDMNEFWKILDERLELCHKALKCRHERLLGTPTSIAPILWQYGALARLGKDEKIDKLLFGGYSTISLGYAGLWECVYGLIKKKITEPEGKELGLKIMQTLNDYCSKWKVDENIDYSLYGTPLESTTYKFAKCLQDRFGVVEGVSDKNYITNSYHIKVTEKVNAFEKLKFESEFQALSPGGAISYIEVPDMKDNIAAVLEVIKFIYDNIMYAELNTKSDYCQECGYDGEIQIVQEGNKLVWRCPNCGNEDQSKLNIARRTCGKQSSEIATIKNDRTSGKPRLYNNFEDYKAGNPEPSSQSNKNSKNSNYKVCDICGRHEKHIIGYYGKKLCNKHYNQIKKYGHVLENSPRTIYDKNEIKVEGEIAYIELYDKLYNVVALAMIDAEDINKVKYSKWRLNCNGYVISTNKFDGKTTFLHRRILNNTNQFVDHINGNVLDNRKQNLRLVTKSQNQMNVNYKGVSKTKNDKHYAHIKIKGKAINLGVYVDEEDALYARYFAEKLLFKEYRFPKEEPFVLTNRKNEIENYVRNRLEKYKDVITNDAENTKNAA